MKKTVALLALLTILFSCKTQNGAVSLFNGKDLTNWKMLPGKVPGFEVTEGNLVTTPPNSSDLFTEEWYGNYVFKFEYLLSEVGNSGVLIRCDPENPWGTGVEVQLLAPWTPYRDDLHCTGSLYGYVPVHNRPDETTGIWHEMEIKCDRNIITISVDGEITTIANTDTVKGMEEKLLEGAIGFQSNHSNEGEYAKFRNVSIRNFDIDPEYVARGFYEKDVRVREQAYRSARSIGAPMVGHLAEMMSEGNITAYSGAKKLLFDLSAEASSPDARKDMRNSVIKALKKSSRKKSYTQDVSDYLGRLLAMLTSDSSLR